MNLTCSVKYMVTFLKASYTEHVRFKRVENLKISQKLHLFMLIVISANRIGHCTKSEKVHYLFKLLRLFILYSFENQQSHYLEKKF